MEKHMENLLAGYNAVAEYVIAVKEGIIAYANPAAVGAADFALLGSSLSEVADPEHLSLFTAEAETGRHLSIPDTRFLHIPCSVDVFSGPPDLFVFRRSEILTPDSAPFTFRSMGNFSTEFRAPVTSLFASANLLRQRLRDADEKTRSYLSIITQNCYRLIRFSNNLTDLSRFSSPSDDFVLENTDFLSFVRNIVSSARPLCELRGVPINFESSAPPLLIGIDREKMERLVLNLLSNSLRYTTADNVIQVRVGASAGYAILTVSDHGSGIRGDLLPSAFNAHRPIVHPPATGYGLGLHLVRQIALLHGGTVMLETREGQGTTVIVSIPNVSANMPYTFKQHRPQYDYAGNLPHVLLELCDVFSSEQFESALRIVSSDARRT